MHFGLLIVCEYAWFFYVNYIGIVACLYHAYGMHLSTEMSLQCGSIETFLCQ